MSNLNIDSEFFKVFIFDKIYRKLNSIFFSAFNFLFRFILSRYFSVCARFHFIFFSEIDLDFLFDALNSSLYAHLIHVENEPNHSFLFVDIMPWQCVATAICKMLKNKNTHSTNSFQRLFLFFFFISVQLLMMKGNTKSFIMDFISDFHA